MFNRRQSQRQNPPDIPIFAPQRFIPIRDLPPFAVQQWYAQHTLPTDERSATVYFAMNPGARDRAYLTTYPP
ncbi:hypothetical protein NCS52_00638300 [Fusarium sp. LHS14.1]|nr:hypothetical protein NCS52_00638300 [Fusarium sp. LHS14.1]